MATKIGDLFFDVYADVSKAVKNIEGIGSAANTAAKAIGQTIANAVGIAVGATALLTASVLSAGVAYNTLGQSATAAFSSIYSSVSAAHDILEQISTLDLTTPFKSDALVGVARTLAGFGVAKNDIIGLTTTLSQATAAMGLGSDALHRMAIAFGQIQSRGKLAGDEARQLANYGIDAYGLIADKIGLSVAAVRELGQESKLTAEFAIPILVDAINTRFAGAIEKLSNTAAGQAEILGSLFRAVGSAIVEPFIGFSGGGAIVESMKVIQNALSSVVAVAEDGSFKLTGFLAPLTPILENIAGAVERTAIGFANFISSIPDDALTRLFDAAEGLGPVLIGVGAALATMFAQAIPFVGRFVAGFNPIVVGLTALALASSEIRESLVTTFDRIWTAVQPLIPGIKELVENLQDLVEDAVPIVLDAIATAVEDLAPAVQSAVDATNSLLDSLGPTFIELLQSAVDILKALSWIIGQLPPDIVVLVGALYALDVLLPTVTTGLVAATAAAGASGGAAALAATSWGILGTAILAAVAAAGAFQAVSAGARGGDAMENFLTKDASLIEKPWQDLAKLTFEAFGPGPGGVDVLRQWQEYDRLVAMNTQTALDFAHSQDVNSMAVSTFREKAEAAGLTYGTLATAVAEFGRMQDEQLTAWMKEAAAADAAMTAADRFELRVISASKGTEDLTAASEEAVDILKELKSAASAAWAEVDKLLRPTQEVTIDDFLRELPKLAEDITNALDAQSKKPDILSALGLSGAEEAVRESARAVVATLAKEYGVGLDGVKALLDERGLGAVIEALGTITKETTETIDPMIAKYASLGATTSQLNDAIARLNDQRSTAIKAQIDQVTAALKDAKQAAEDARKAFDDYFKGSAGGLQGAIDKLVLAIPNVGDSIEAGLLKGGPQGEAMVRQALGGAGDALGQIFQLGLEQGLSPEQIMDMLGPVYGSIQQELSGALNRISSLDWTEGFTPAAAAEIQGWFASILDPGQIGQLFANILGADSTVSGLEQRLEGLNAALNVDVEFSPAQVQGALDAITEEQKKITTTPVVTPEAAQLVYQAIQDVLSDPTNELSAAVDQALVTQQILDAAQAAEDQISLVFKSALSFNSEELDMIARGVSEEFYAAFNQRLQELRDEAAQLYGFDSFSAMTAALGPAVANATIGVTPALTNQTVQIDAPITVNGVPDPRTTATETVAAMSAAAGSGGSLSRSLADIYGVETVGYRGPH